jgi:DNA-binding GntR family transcriptional regulator
LSRLRSPSGWASAGRPIRGALQWLHREGYVVEHKGNRKARIVVAPLTREDARELYLIVGNLEALAGTMAVTFPTNVRAKLADELAALNEQLNVIASQRPVDPRPRVRNRQGISRAHHQRGRRQAALGAAQLGAAQVERYWRLYASSIISELHVSVSEHNEIVRAIRKGDATAVHDALQRNWTGGYDRISRLIESSANGEAGRETGQGEQGPGLRTWRFARSKIVLHFRM